MKRCRRIYEHPLFKRCMERINAKERDRKFCLHGIEHSLDTARIGYISILENGLPIDKELFYAAALLHDTGRYSGMPHHEAGAENARIIMPQCGFTEEETEAAAEAILGHRNQGSVSGTLASVLYDADKRSRLCFCCGAADECYWPQEKRNGFIRA
ncbi:MAG TPA: HD domain-containing protein [Candidatus Ornithomonoglobus merdipullorum]|uniref:HD domain-containing protein n=1 Tax=Candidatus Ornithomonoglobus merdipullorum TaxID=2840895 RepID=A0A9D1MAS4_9FIRM|nr:HD domain-containing protein [Candidatus Ornithomonoglobus merdipullorum]